MGNKTVTPNLNSFSFFFFLKKVRGVKTRDTNQYTSHIFIGDFIECSVGTTQQTKHHPRGKMSSVRCEDIG